jgi:hypothetical protein
LHLIEELRRYADELRLTGPSSGSKRRMWIAPTSSPGYGSIRYSTASGPILVSPRC